MSLLLLFSRTPVTFEETLADGFKQSDMTAANVGLTLPLDGLDG
jgi:hypothetical protein